MTRTSLKKAFSAAAFVALSAAPLLTPIPLLAQAPAAPAGRGGGRAGRPVAYPDRPQGEQAMIDRGKALYGVNCNFCHGSDARGGEGGPNLLRSDIVLNDKNGEAIAVVVQNGRGEMPKIPLTLAQVSDVAAYIRSFHVNGNEGSRMLPPSILVGDAQAGETYFRATCTPCHSATGDLKGIASKYPEPKLLQNHWLMPGGGRGGRGGAQSTPTTVTVTMASGQKLEGRLGRIDDFVVTLTDAEGAPHTVRRDGDMPKVEVHDPMQPHKNLLPKYADKDIHNLTSYLVTLK